MKKLLILIIFLVFCYEVKARTEPQSMVRKLPFTKTLANTLANSEQIHDRLVIKFKETLKIRMEDGSLTSLNHLNENELLEMFTLVDEMAKAGLALNPVFSSPSHVLDERQNALMQISRQSIADLNAYVFASLPRNSEGIDFLYLIKRLNRLSIIEVAYLKVPNNDLVLYESDPPIDSYVNPEATPLLVGHQGYFNDAPQGVGIFKAWQKPGGRGNGIKVIAYDNSYLNTHEDVPNLFYDTNNPNQLVDETHGTAVLGILGAKFNGIGMIGGVFESQIGFQKAAPKFGGSHAQKLFEAAEELTAGDVIVITVGLKVEALGFECPDYPSQANSVPMEFYPDEYDMISSIVASGISVVESAGNGCVDFDSDVFLDLFSEGNGSSGAFWVTASNSNERSPKVYSNFGSRVDFNAWGDSVAVLSFLREDEMAIFDEGLDRRYGPNFGGSSSAAPIVATCVASLQGQAKAAWGGVLAPQEIKGLIINFGGQSQISDFDRPIGVMPDLEVINF